jgi:hypothetical protein
MISIEWPIDYLSFYLILTNSKYKASKTNKKNEMKK